MAKWLKRLLLVVWGLCLIPALAPIVEKLLHDSIHADRDSIASALLHGDVVVTAFNTLAELNQQRWFTVTLLLLTGTVVGAALESLSHRWDRRNAVELRSIGSKFRSLSDSIRLRTATSAWPDGASDLQPAIRVALSSAEKFGLWVPNERIYQLPDASFLCEYFRCVGKFLEDGEFDQAASEAESWKPFLGHENKAR